ncbi:MAG: BrnT family toxin [Spirochaetaceae bacterium]|jgi:uncharacterized DUF497 family protein|nr:BrnT family toxin [Spirochaetaceae bacterium]
MIFDWNAAKEKDNIEKHHVNFTQAQKAFDDPLHFTRKDTRHSGRRNRYNEDRFFCYGCDEYGVLTVRYTRRNHITWIFGAGYWNEGEELYAAKNWDG